ncbi:tetratricopeptide repeat protein [bacterium]|nr:tetratricopeptide repeat protein [bacterium]
MQPRQMCVPAIAMVLALTGCASAPSAEEKIMLDAEAQSILPASRADRDAIGQQELLAQAAFWNKEYENNPNDYESALKLANVLRAIGSTQRAADVAAQALALKPGDVGLTMVLAQAALDLGRPETAVPALANAEAAGSDDWRMMSLIGVTMDALGQHVGAQGYYLKALALSPDNPSVLSNYGLSLALSGKAKEAEEKLRIAAAAPGADARVRQNLSLILGVQGKFDEAVTVIEAETPKPLLESQATYFRALLSPNRTWRDLDSASPSAG